MVVKKAADRALQVPPHHFDGGKRCYVGWMGWVGGVNPNAFNSSSLSSSSVNSGWRASMVRRCSKRAGGPCSCCLLS